MKLVDKTMKTVLLVMILMATLIAASVLPSEPITTEQQQQSPRQKSESSKSPAASSVDLYKNMVMFEQEQGNSDDDDDDDNDDGKDNDDSLLSVMTDGVKDDEAVFDDQHTMLLKCASCSGILPFWRDQRNSLVDEQSFCLPDVGGSTIQQGKTLTGHENYQSVCIGAVRCWKAIVREREGFIRVSRGCVGTGGGGSNRHLSKAASAQQLRLHPCMGAVPVVRSSGNENMSESKENHRQSPYTVWTSSYSYSSADSSQQRPPSYAIECCAGHDLCNDGSFPFLPGDGLMTEDSSLLTSGIWWRWSSISVLTLLLALIIIVIVTFKFFKNSDKTRHRKRRRHRSKNSSRSNSKRFKRCAHGFCKDEGVHSDDSDKKPHRRFSFTSDSSFSSLSSIGSSSSCCEGKPRRMRSRRKPHVTTLNMLDLLKDVVVTNDATDEGDSHRPSYAIAYSPAAVTESTLDDDFLPPPYQKNDHQNDWTSGSGYGMPVLVQRTLAKQIQLRQLVGKGRYGEVWRATYWNGGHEHVAVKIFLSKDEPSWKRETEIYSTVLMRHDNILGFIGSDIMTSRNSYTTQLLLITHYHQHGSLYDFLQTPLAIDTACNGYNTGAYNTTADRPPLTMTQMLNILYTVAAGLCHLHTEIHGTQGKPGIAHRDIKSKNVLVKCAQTGACCVADFGMAVTSRDATLPAQTTTAAGAGNQNTRVGTKRYMAPEVLDDSILSAAMLSLASTSSIGIKTGSAATVSPSAYWCFDAYRRGDVYSYALVVWEVLSRTLMSPKIDNDDLLKHQQSIFDNEYNPYVYRAPYQDRGAGWDPGFDDMRHIVCSPDPVLSRPGVAARWLANPIVNAVVVTMRECWHNNPNARLPMLRVKKTLVKLKDQYAQIEKNEQLTETTTTD